MKTLFVHDTIFLRKNDKIYSNALPYSILKRYSDVFSQVTVLARVRDTEEVGNIPLASGNNVVFVFLENISTLRSFFGLRREHQKYITHLMTDHHTVIARLPSELGLLTIKVARENNVKYLIEVVGCAWDALWNYGGWKAKIYAPFLFIRMKKAVKRADYVSYVTERFLQERYPSTEKAMTIGVSDVALPDADENILLQRIRKIDNLKEKIVFGTIASLTVKYKGIESALKTLSEIAAHHSNFEYHILGEGDPVPYKKIADELGIGNKVFFDGTLIGGEAVLHWLDNIDIYLQPSFQEGLPRALIEAMSRGCPAIGSSVGGIPELLDAELTFSHKYPKKFSEIIVSLIPNKALMRDVSKQNFLTAKKYQKSLLDKKRKKFWIDFRDEQ